MQRELLGEVQEETEYLGTPIELRMRQPKHELVLPLKRQAFKRAITNLVSNAVRFGDQIIIRAAVEGQWVRVEVDDNGPGIPLSERGNVFSPPGRTASTVVRKASALPAASITVSWRRFS